MAKKSEVKETKVKTTKETKKPAKKVETKKPTKKAKTKKQNIFARFFQYLKDVRAEMGKVRWPNRKEMLLYSAATFGFILLFAAFFALNDVIIGAFKQLVR